MYCYFLEALQYDFSFRFFIDGYPWYLPEPKTSENAWGKFKDFINVFASFVVIFNYIIPISLYVTMGKDSVLN